MKPMQYKGYLGSVECSVEDDCLQGKLLYVNDLVACEADSPVGLKQAFEEAGDDYLSTCGQLSLNEFVAQAVREKVERYGE